MVSHIERYLSMTEKLRQDNGFLISYQKPYQHVTTATISRWIKTVLRNSGINVDIYGAHSTRSAASSACLANETPVDIILNKIGWSSERTFAKFYNKHVETKSLPLHLK